jgi:hypothetical protein
MSELAFNVNGEPFDMPPTMAAWRVRKLKHKGAPDVVYGRDGLPLFLAMDADIEDLRREARGDGRYRLDPVDDHNRPIPSAEAAYICVRPVEPQPAPTASAVRATAINADTTAQLINALLESQRQHSEMARMYVSTFPVLVNALAGVVRAAGDAGLLERMPLAVPIAAEAKPVEPIDSDKVMEGANSDDDEPDEEDIEVAEAAPEPAWVRFGSRMVEKFGPQIESLLGGLAGAATVWGAKRGTDSPGAAVKPATADAAVDPMAHLNAVLAALRPDEAKVAMQMANALPFAEKLAYAQQLIAMPVPEALTVVRARLVELPGRRDADKPSDDVSAAELDALLRAIHAALSDEESQTVQLLAEELPSTLRRNYFDKLAGMAVPDAVTYVRTELAQLGSNRATERSTGPARDAPATHAPDLDPRATPSAPMARRRDGWRVAGSALDARPGSSPPAATVPGGGLGQIPPAAQAHIAAIQGQLTAEEGTTARAYVASLSQAARSTWIGRLLVLTVADAVSMIRTQLAASRLDAERDRTDAPDARATATEIVLRNVAEPLDDATPPGESPVSAPTTPPGPNESTMAGEPFAAAHPQPSIVGAEPIRVTAIEELSADRRQLDMRTNDARELDQHADDVQEAGSAASAAVRRPSAALAVPAVLPSTELLILDAAAHPHFDAIERALTLAERMRLQEIVAQRPASELRAWIGELANAPVPEAVVRLRTALAVADGTTLLRELKDIAPRTTQDAQQSQAPRTLTRRTQTRPSRRRHRRTTPRRRSQR